MRPMPKIVSFTRELIEYDLTGLSRKDIKHVLDICMGRADMESDEWLEYLTGKKTQVFQEALEKHVKGGGGFELTEFDTDFIKPYLERLTEWTGFEFPKNLEVPIRSLNGLCHTHYTQEAKIIAGVLRVKMSNHVYLRSNENQITDEWRKNRSVQDCTRYAIEELGRVDPEREYTEVQGGLYRRNPNWASGKPSKVHQVCYNENVWQELFGFWFEKFATKEQQQIIGRMAKISNCDEKYPSLRDYGTIHLDDYHTTIKIEDFKAGKVPPFPVLKPQEK